jgi:hypothetical protein
VCDAPPNPNKLIFLRLLSLRPSISLVKSNRQFFLSVSRKLFVAGVAYRQPRLVAISAGNPPTNDRQRVGVHDANLLYAHKADFSFSVVEKLGLLECGLAGLENENVPVWSWLAELSRLYPALLGHRTIDGEEVERVGALTAIRLLGVPLEKLKFSATDPALDSWLQSGTPAAVKVAAIRYLRDYGTGAELEAVQREAGLATNETVEVAIEAAVAILLRENEATAVRYLLSVSFESLASEVVHSALVHLGELGSGGAIAGPRPSLAYRPGAHARRAERAQCA